VRDGGGATYSGVSARCLPVPWQQLRESTIGMGRNALQHVLEIRPVVVHRLPDRALGQHDIRLLVEPRLDRLSRNM